MLNNPTSSIRIEEGVPIHSKPLLIGSTFPLSLIRRQVMISPEGLEALTEELRGKTVFSFWGHENTVYLAEKLLGVDVRPTLPRPVVTLTGDGYPSLAGHVFRECWVLSPDYVDGFRPKIGEEVPSDKIVGWQVLRIVWKEAI